eukprot:SAG22_NODE_643_length_8222_cov_5.448972_7_plen_295_part_00
MPGHWYVITRRYGRTGTWRRRLWVDQFLFRVQCDDRECRTVPWHRGRYRSDTDHRRPRWRAASASMLPAAAAAAALVGLTWPYRMGGVSRSRAVLSPDGETVYLGSFDNTTATFPFHPPGRLGPTALHAVRTADGEHLWSFDIAACVHSVGEAAKLPSCHSCGSFNTPALSHDGSTLFLGGDDSRMWAVSARDASVRWNRTVGSVVLSTAALSPDGALLVFDDDENKGTGLKTGSQLVALNASDGSQVWAVGGCQGLKAKGHVGGCGWFSDPLIVGDRCVPLLAQDSTRSLGAR